GFNDTPVTPPLDHGPNLQMAGFSPDGSRVLTWGNGTFRVWRVIDGKPLTPLLQGHVWGKPVFSPDGSRLLTFDGGTGQLWDADTGRALTPPLRSPTFSSDFRRLAAIEYVSARVWDTTTGAALLPPLHQGGQVNAVLFSPDGRRLLTLDS